MVLFSGNWELPEAAPVGKKKIRTALGDSRGILKQYLPFVPELHWGLFGSKADTPIATARTVISGPHWREESRLGGGQFAPDVDHSWRASGIHESWRWYR